MVAAVRTRHLLAALMGCSLLLPACGMDDSSVSGTSIVVPPRLRTSSVNVGLSSGPVLPIVANGSLDDRGSVWSFDSRTKSIQKLETNLPMDGWIGPTAATANENWIVVASAECSKQPIEADTGPECPEERPRFRLFFSELDDAQWSSAEVEISALPRLEFSSPNDVVLDTYDEAGDPVSISVSLDGSRVVDTRPTSGRRCSITIGRTPRFPAGTAGASEVALLPSAPDGAANSIKLPTTVDVAPDGNMLCASSDLHLALPSSTLGIIDPPGAEVPPEGPGSQKANRVDLPPPTVDGPIGPEVQVYDLANPQEDPRALGDTATMRGLIEGNDYWALVDAEGIHLVDDSNDIRTFEVDSAFSVIGMPSGAVNYSSDRSGGIDSFRYIEL